MRPALLGRAHWRQLEVAGLKLGGGWPPWAHWLAIASTFLVLLGAAAGPTTTNNGAHLAAVMPWVPMLTVPTGDGSRRGYGRYIGSADDADACGGHQRPVPP
mgnify:CR=1 FL=1